MNRKHYILLIFLMAVITATGCMQTSDSEDTDDQALVGSTGSTMSTSLGSKSLQIKILKCSPPNTNRLSTVPEPASNAKIYIIPSSTSSRECLPIAKIAESITSGDGSVAFSLSDPSLKYTLLIDLDQNGLPDDRYFDISPLDKIEILSFPNNGTASLWADIKISPDSVDHSSIIKIDFKGYSEQSCQADITIYNQVTGTMLWKSDQYTLGGNFQKSIYFEIPLSWPSSSSNSIYIAAVNILDSTTNQRQIYSGSKFTINGTLLGTFEPAGSAGITVSQASILDDTPFLADISLTSKQPYYKFADISVDQNFDNFERIEFIWSDQYIKELENLKNGNDNGAGAGMNAQTYPELTRVIQIQLTPESGAKRIYARFADLKGIFSLHCHADMEIFLTDEIVLTAEPVIPEPVLTNEQTITSDTDPMIQISSLEIDSETNILNIEWEHENCPENSFLLLYLLKKNDLTKPISSLVKEDILTSNFNFGPFAPASDSQTINISSIDQDTYIPIFILNTSGNISSYLFSSFNVITEFTYIKDNQPQPNPPSQTEPDPEPVTFANSIKLLMPADMSNNASSTGLLTWQTLDAENNPFTNSKILFSAYLDNSPDPLTLFIENSKGLSATYSGLAKNKTYYWYVQGENSQGQTLKSTVSSFTIPDFPKITLSTPQNSELLSGIQYISWQLSGPAPENALVTISFSINNGTWITLVTNISPQGPYEFDTTRLGSDNKYKFRVILKNSESFSMDENSEFVEIKQLK